VRFYQNSHPILIFYAQKQISSNAAMTVFSFFAESAMTDLSKAIGSLQSNQATERTIG